MKDDTSFEVKDFEISPYSRMLQRSPELVYEGGKVALSDVHLITINEQEFQYLGEKAKGNLIFAPLILKHTDIWFYDMPQSPRLIDSYKRKSNTRFKYYSLPDGTIQRISARHIAIDYPGRPEVIRLMRDSNSNIGLSVLPILISCFFGAGALYTLSGPFGGFNSEDLPAVLAASGIALASFGFGVLLINNGQKQKQKAMKLLIGQN